MSAQNLASVPIIDLRGSDFTSNHTDVHSYSIRARMDRDLGTHAGSAMWTGPTLLNDPVANEQAFDVMDEWLTRIEADDSTTTLATKVRADKPAAAADACWVAGRKVTDQNVCRAAFPYFSTPAWSPVAR
jgi:hypothetical protein